MKILFLGATRFSYELLETLLNNRYEVTAILTHPKVFRISYSSEPVVNYNYSDLKLLGKQFGVPVVEVVDNLNNYMNEIERLAPDLILALGWYFMIPKKIRNIAPKGCAGIHASLLPKYAGGAPLVWAIINGEKETGVSFFYLGSGVDTGDIIAQEKLPIEYNDDISTLYNRATIISKGIFLKYLPLIEAGTAPRIKQDLTKRTIYPQRNPDDGWIDWTKPAEEIRNFIRAQTRPYPGAFSYANGKKINIWKAEVTKNKKCVSGIPGQIISIENNSLLVETKEGCFRITDYEPRNLNELIRLNSPIIFDFPLQKIKSKVI